MVNVNKKYLKADLSGPVWKDFIKGLENVKIKSDFDKLSEKFLTPAERIMLEKRLAVLFLLKKGISHREIGRILDVSPTTVAFVKNKFFEK